MPKLGFWWWVGAYFKVCFSREMWLSWYFVLFYFLMALTHLERASFDLWLLLKQGAALVALALVFGAVGVIGALAKMRNQREIQNGPS